MSKSQTVHVYVTTKREVLDPQGKAILGGLKLGGYKGIEDVRLGKFIEIKMQNPTDETVRKMCNDLLANTVIEDFRFEVVE